MEASEAATHPRRKGVARVVTMFGNDNFEIGRSMRKRLALMCVVLAVAVGAVDPAQRIVAAQPPEEEPQPQETPPESFKDFLKQQWTRPTPQSNEPAPDTADDTINVMKRAMGRASGTPQPEPTPKW
jgi:hypothetical protein